MTDRLPGPAEREAAIARLSAAFADDVLHIEEFERRVAEAYRVQNSRALALLVDDLPVAAPVPAVAVQAATPAVRLSACITSMFGNVERRGRIAVPARVKIGALLANVELDLREADFASGVTEIAIDSLLANVELWLPEHVTVENHGASLIGSFTSAAGRASRPMPGLQPPVVRIRGRALLANVEIHGA